MVSMKQHRGELGHVVLPPSRCARRNNEARTSKALSNPVIREDQPRVQCNPRHVAREAIFLHRLIWMTFEAALAIPRRIALCVVVGIVAGNAGEFSGGEAATAFQANELIADVDAVFRITFRLLPMAVSTNAHQHLCALPGWIQNTRSCDGMVIGAGVTGNTSDSALKTC